MHVSIYDLAKLPVRTALTFSVLRYDAYAQWGPHTADVEVHGTREALEALRHWLGFYVIIYNDNGRPVWWGKITDVDAPHGGKTINVSFSQMYNRVRSLFIYLESDGYAVNGASDWTAHQRSVDTYGRKELRQSIGQASLAQANAAALTKLTESALIPLGTSLNNSESAMLHCSGLGKLLDWTYYENLAGYESYQGIETAEQIIGWGVTASDIGFTDRAIHKMSDSLGRLNEDDRILVSGSPANSIALTASGASAEPDSYTAATISFSAGDDILDSAAGLGFLRMGAFVSILGSAGNSGNHLIDETGRDHAATDTTVTGTIDTEAAGPSITIAQASTVSVLEDVVTETPGAAVTLKGPQKARYSFTPSYDATWAMHEVWIRARAEGNPGDALSISIYTDSAGDLGTLLDSGLVAVTSKSTDWVSAPLTDGVSLSYGNTYWIVVERTGANNTANYYVLGVDGEGLGDGTYAVFNGAVWVSGYFSLPFQIWGHKTTTDQIEEILIAQGQFFSGSDVRVDSDVMSRQYRDGSLDTGAELENLLNAGTSTGETILARVTEDWRAVVDVAPSSAIPNYRILYDGRLATVRGNPVEQGLLPVGEWVSIDGFSGEDDALIAGGPFLAGYMEYNALQARITDIQPYGTDSVWDADPFVQG